MEISIASHLLIECDGGFLYLVALCQLATDVVEACYSGAGRTGPRAVRSERLVRASLVNACMHFLPRYLPCFSHSTVVAFALLNRYSTNNIFRRAFFAYVARPSLFHSAIHSDAPHHLHSPASLQPTSRTVHAYILPSLRIDSISLPFLLTHSILISSRRANTSNQPSHPLPRYTFTPFVPRIYVQRSRADSFTLSPTNCLHN